MIIRTALPVALMVCAWWVDPGVTAQAQGALPPRYVVRDTGEWDCGGIGGWFGTLYENGNPVDTVDLSFGVQAVPTGVLFLPMVRMTGGDPQPGHAELCPAEYVLYDGERRTGLGVLLSDFDDFLSSPTVIDSVLYYWGVKPVDTLKWFYNASAARYDFRTGERRALDLWMVNPETDDPSFLPTPRDSGGLIQYRFENRAVWVNRRHEVVRRDKPPRPRFEVEQAGTLVCPAVVTQFSLDVLYDRGRYVDTIVTHFRYGQLPGDRILYMVARPSPPGRARAGPPAPCPGEYIVYDGVRRERLRWMVPGFDDDKSSPALIDSVLYYWRLAAVDSSRGLYAISAARYDFRTGEMQATPLWTEQVAGLRTQRAGAFLYPPQKSQGRIAYTTSGTRGVWVSERLEILEEIQVRRR